MTNTATEVMEAFYENFDGFCSPMYNECVANVLQHLIDEHSEVRGTGRVDKKSKVVSVKTLMKLIEELEND